MKSCLKSVLLASAVLFAVGIFPAEEASAQGPIIRRMRERLNGGKPLLPFVEDIEAASREESKKRPTPATKKPTPASKKQPTPAGKRPTPADKSKASKKANPKIKLESPGRSSTGNNQDAAAKGFGMVLQQVGDDFFVGKVDPRGNAAEAGLRRGDLVEEIGGAPVKVIEEFDAIAKAMRGGDRVEFTVSRRGSKAEKVIVQFGQPDPIEEDDDESNPIELLPADLEPTPAATRRSFSDRYEPAAGSGMKSIYDGAQKPSSILEPTPAPTRANRVESLEDLDFPALEGGK